MLHTNIILTADFLFSSSLPVALLLLLLCLCGAGAGAGTQFVPVASGYEGACHQWGTEGAKPEDVVSNHFCYPQC